MEAAKSSPDPAEADHTEASHAAARSPSDYSTPLLEALFTGRDRRYQALGSLLFGLLGIAVLAVGTSVLAGAGLAWADQRGMLARLHPVIAISAVMVLAAFVYPTAIMALQLFASIDLPITLRVLLVYATLYACLRSLTFGIHVSADAAALLFCAPICLGGFIARHVFGYSAVSWSQPARPIGKASIALLLDLTAAIAITMGIASTIQLNWKGLPCLVPTFLLLAVMGMHPWARLCALSDVKGDRETGFAFWTAGNLMWGCGMFLLIAVAGSKSVFTALLAFVVPPMIVLIAHVYTTLPLAWLRACGWRFVRAESSRQDRPPAQPARFKSSI